MNVGKRRAFTLVETLVVMATLSVVLAMLSIVMHSLYRSSEGLSDRLDYQRQVDRFTWQLRNDVHAADSASLVTAERDATVKVLRLEYSDQRRVDYAVRAQQVARVERTADKITAKDTFDVLPATDKALRIDQQGEGSLVTITLREQPERDVPAAREKPVCQISAAVGVMAELDATTADAAPGSRQ